jgi:apolipoprotein N-acyltransferase
VALAVLLAAVAPAGTGTGQWMTVAAVQGGGEQGTRARDVPSSMVFRRHLEATRTIAPDPELDLVLWPENVIDVDDEPFVGSEQHRLLVAGEAARLGVPFSVGVTEDADVTGMGTAAQTTNAQIVVTPDGEVTSRYDKVRRVPFGEYVPAADVARDARCPGRPGPDERRARRRPGDQRVARRHDDRRS